MNAEHAPKNAPFTSTLAMHGIVIGGNIASGKTTVAPAVADAIGACFSPEPVEMWRASGKLDDFYLGKI